MSDNQLSGRDIDVAMATKVMQWPVEPYGTHNGNHEWLNDPVNYPHAEIADDPLPYTGLLLWKDVESDGVYWSPSLSIEAAMQVLQKLRDSGEWCCLDIHSNYNHEWRVTLTRGTNDENDPHQPAVNVADESLPRAICLAAWKAVESK